MQTEEKYQPTTITLIADNDESFVFPFKQISKKSKFIQKFLTACDNNPNIKKTTVFNVDYDQAIVRIYHKYITLKRLPKKVSFAYNNYDFINGLLTFADYIGDDDFKYELQFEREFRPLLRGMNIMADWIDDLFSDDRKQLNVYNIDKEMWLSNLKAKYQLTKNIDRAKQSLTWYLKYITEIFHMDSEDLSCNDDIPTVLNSMVESLGVVLNEVHNCFLIVRNDDATRYELFRAWCLYKNMSENDQVENIENIILYIYSKQIDHGDDILDQRIEEYKAKNDIKELMAWGDNLIKYYNEDGLKITTMCMNSYTF